MNIKKKYKKIKKYLRTWYKKIDHLTGGILSILKRTFQRFSEERGSEAAASLAYYAFFSIFPMLLVIITIGSFFVDRAVVQTQILNLLRGILPGIEEVIIRNINRVLELRGAVTFVALISLVWSATSVFNVLAKNINRAFRRASEPNFIKGRVLGFLMFFALILLMGLSFSATTAFSLIKATNFQLFSRVFDTTILFQIAAFFLPVIINLLMFWALYYFVPTIQISKKASLIGGAITGVAWEVLNNAFSWYLSSGFSRYQLVYGSVGTIVALLFWIYLTATITMVGAHLTSSIQLAMKQKADADSHAALPAPALFSCW